MKNHLLIRRQKQEGRFISPRLKRGFPYVGLMKDVTNPGWIKLKGILFLTLGLCSSVMLLLEHPDWRVATLLIISLWGFCRFYYFAFYVIEHYVDPGFRFSGLWSFTRYLISKRRRSGPRL